MKNVKGFLLLTGLLLASSAFAAVREGDVALTADYTAVEIENSDSIGIALKVANSADEEACVSLHTESNYDGVYAKLPKSDFCVVGGQSLEFAVSVQAKDSAEKGGYEIEVIAEYGGFEETLTIDVIVQ